MKSLILLSLFLTFSIQAQSEKAAKAKARPTVYKVSPGSSKAVWAGKKVTGKHTGTVKIKKGSMVFKGTQWTGGEFFMDMKSITVTDLTGEWKTKLEGHLKNADFFDVGKYPTAKLKIKSIRFGKGGKYDVSGDLTIKGKPRPISFRADVQQKGSLVTASAKITIDRTAYGIRYNSGKFFQGLGDKLIYDKFTLNVKLRAKK